MTLAPAFEATVVPLAGAPEAASLSSAGADDPTGNDWLLDDPAEWPAFSRETSAARFAGQDCWESDVAVSGMRCAACALAIEDALKAVPGVLDAHVQGAAGRARVIWSARVVKPSQWIEAVRRAGYVALPAGDAGARMQRRQAQRMALWRWLVAGFCMMQVMMYATPAYLAAPGDITPDMLALLRWASWVLTLPVVLFSCAPFFANALRDLRQRRISMDLPVALGMAITFAVSSAGTFDPGGPFGQEVYFDSLTMFVFFLLTGRWLEGRLRDRTAGALEALLHRMPDSVERLARPGHFERVAVRRLVVGDIVRVLPGERFPADGRVLEGRTLADEALLTGESRPLPRGPGERVLAGSHNLSAAVQVEVEQIGLTTRFAQIVALMDNAALHKPAIAQLADRIAVPFLLAILLVAGIAGWLWWSVDPARALMVSVAVLVVTCPCALSLATPAAMLASAGSLARQGVLVRRLPSLEALAAVDTVVFDKTGTLTQDGMTVTSVHVRENASRAAVLAEAAALASHSLHPVSRALVAAGEAQAPAAGAPIFASVLELPGSGLSGVLTLRGDVNAPRTLRLGSASHCGLDRADTPQQQVHLADDKGWLATFELSERVRPDASAAIGALKNAGLKALLLSGDRGAATARVARQVGIDEAWGDCTPEDKLARLLALQGQGHRVAMVGDGLNDTPVLAGAHVSFAFGQAVPLARNRADLVVLGDRLALVPMTLRQARRTLRVVRQNLGWALAYNVVCVPLAVAGWLPAWLAGLGMAASSLLVVLNAARLARTARPDALAEPA